MSSWPLRILQILSYHKGVVLESGGGAEEMVQWIKLLIYMHEDCNSFQKETKQNRRVIDPSYRSRKSMGQSD